MSIESQVIARIGELPLGDPAAMLRHAARLREEATQLVVRARAVRARVDAANYECPAADRLRSEVQDAEARLMACAARLNNLADSVTRAAGRVSSDQDWWHREFARLSQELAAGARTV